MTDSKVKSSAAVTAPDSAREPAVARPGKQTLPSCLQILSESELIKLSQYQHQHSKTHYELFLRSYPVSFLERLHPSFLSANSITLIGQMALPLMVFAIFIREGCNIAPHCLIDPQLLLIAALAVQWFSWYDIADGLRAGRLKNGSPLGRIIDEGGDAIAKSFMSVLVAYALVFDNVVLEISFLMLNIAFYGMETKHKISGKLVLSLPGVGSVEVELLISTILALCGYYGQAGVQETVQERFSLAPDSMFASIGSVRIASILGVIFTVL